MPKILKDKQRTVVIELTQDELELLAYMAELADADSHCEMDGRCSEINAMKEWIYGLWHGTYKAPADIELE